MIVCHRHRFIFIKTRKTAGTSTEIALSRFCDKGDIVTPVGDDERQRSEEGGHPPVNWAKPLHQHLRVREWRRLLKRGKRTARLSGHATADRVRGYLGAEIWDSYFTFTIERNPWDRVVSAYWWDKFRWERRGRGGFPAIREYLRFLEREKPHRLSGWYQYAEGDRILVDRVLSYENLQSDLNRLAQERHLPGGVELPRRRAKGAARSDRQHYSEVLSKNDRALIERHCEREIAAFGYRFEPHAVCGLSA